VKKLEIERKFLVKFASWQNLFDLLDNLVSIKRIEQVYLRSIKGDPSARIRKTVEGFRSKKTYFDINQKKQLGAAKNKEVEKRISESEYKKLLSHKDPSKKILTKTRLVFNYQNQIFELDIFKDYLDGLKILEIELESENQKIDLPPYLKIVREITDEEDLNNFNLSDIKVKGFKDGKIKRI
jgi:CYTH domain-containing protein